MGVVLHSCWTAGLAQLACGPCGRISLRGRMFREGRCYRPEATTLLILSSAWLVKWRNPGYASRRLTTRYRTIVSSLLSCAHLLSLASSILLDSYLSLPSSTPNQPLSPRYQSNKMDEMKQQALERFFQQNSKPTAAQRESIARALVLPGRTVQLWFAERRVRAKADKEVELQQARTALANASQMPADENIPTFPSKVPTDHSKQSAASYVSLHRSLEAARACMPPVEPIYDMSMPVSPGFHLGMNYPMCSPTASSFDQSSSMVRTDSEYSGFSTPGEVPDSFGQYSFFPEQSEYQIDFNNAHSNNMYTINQCRARPALHRSWTTLESNMGRPVPRRTISASLVDRMPNATEPVRIKRRPKLSNLGVGMARSRSSLGYDQAEFPYSTKRGVESPTEFHCPITPVRRISSSVAVPTLASLRSGSNASTISMESSDLELTSRTGESFSTMQFPPSPISPEHATTLFHDLKSVSTLDLQRVPTQQDNFTPPPTPLSVLTSSDENSLAGLFAEGQWNSSFKTSSLDLMTNNDPMLTDFLQEHDLSMQLF